MKNLQKGNVGVILLIIVVLIAGGWYLYSNKKGVVDSEVNGDVNSMQLEDSVSSVSQIPEAGDSVPADWQSFIHPEYNFKITYPKGWHRDSELIIGGNANTIIKFSDPETRQEDVNHRIEDAVLIDEKSNCVDRDWTESELAGYYKVSCLPKLPGLMVYTTAYSEKAMQTIDRIISSISSTTH